jgi:hypothetical protein
MPSRNSWNGRWSGEENYYAIVRTLPAGKKHSEKAARIVANGPYRHSFGDGWAAQVNVKILGSKDITRARKRSRGFCGYDWMVDDILQHGEIRP